VKKLTTPLRGFLFNILADRQHICGNDTTTPLKSTSPKGGDGVYKFKWEISYNLAEWDTAPGKNHKEEYFPGLEIREAYFRRIVSSAEVEDTSNIVHFMRGIPVEKTSIKGDQIICDGTLPAPLTENKQELSSASDEFTYTWQYRQLGNEWTAILDSDSPHYQPGALHETTFYRRIVQSGACMDTSNVVVVGIIHLPEIQLQFLGDSLEQGQDIELTAIISGEESFSIQWMRDEEKISGAVGTSLLIPDIDSKDAGNYYFIVTNQCGSVFSDTIFIYIHETNSEHGLHSTGNIELYPNPAGNFLHVNHSFTDPYKISIFNAVGHLVMEESNNDHLSLEHIPDGIYILRIACPDQETHLTYRFVIKR